MGRASELRPGEKPQAHGTEQQLPMRKDPHGAEGHGVRSGEGHGKEGPPGGEGHGRGRGKGEDTGVWRATGGGPQVGRDPGQGGATGGEGHGGAWVGRGATGGEGHGSRNNRAALEHRRGGTVSKGERPQETHTGGYRGDGSQNGQKWRAGGHTAVTVFMTF